MISWIALLRGINVGGNNQLPMETLRQVCTLVGCENPRTYIQSGNVLFGSRTRKASTLAEQLESAIEEKCGFRPAVVLRTSAEIRLVVEENPFPAEALESPAKLAVSFLQQPPECGSALDLHQFALTGEQLRLVGKNLYIYYPIGQGNSKLQHSKLDRALRGPGGSPNPGTTRNWNTVNKLLAMAEKA